MAFDDQFVRAARFAFGYFQNLVGGRYGVSWRDEYELFEGETNELPPPLPEQALLGDIGTSTVALARDEHPFGALRALRTVRMHIEPVVYLQAVLTDFRLAGGRVVVREFSERSLISELPHALVVNCTGLGAGELVPPRRKSSSTSKARLSVSGTRSFEPRDDLRTSVRVVTVAGVAAVARARPDPPRWSHEAEFDKLRVVDAPGDQQTHSWNDDERSEGKTAHRR